MGLYQIGSVCLYMVRSLEDDPCSGQPRCTSTPELIVKVHHIILEDHQLTVQEVAVAVEISSRIMYEV